MGEHGNLKRTPLFEEHVRLGARIVPFAGFEMPVQYTGVIDEHQTVRQRAGLFDVSHMGEIFVRGPRALDFVQRVSCNDHSKMKAGRAQYTGLMYPQGTFVDDMLVHKMDEDEYLLVVNAANVAKDFEYLAGLAEGESGVRVDNESDRWAQIAFQGQLAQGLLAPMVDVDLGEIRYYRFTSGKVLGHPAIIARTGYTGEDGFELYVEPGAAPEIWRAILDAGADDGVAPAGLGARDTLRLEAGMCLYGNDIDDTTTPLEAGLQWIVKLDKGDFIGRDILERQHEEGLERRLVGFEVIDRGIARHGHLLAVDPDAEPVGVVTSGTHSPTLGKAVGLGYVPVSSAEPGMDLWIEVRGRRLRAVVVPLPFYSRKRKAEGKKK